MKIGHLSDVHAGYASTKAVNAQGINLREADGYRAFYQVITEAIEEEIDALLIAGDLFHSPSPTVNSIYYVQQQLRRLAKAKIPVYILTGNHDTKDVKSDLAATRLVDDKARKIYAYSDPYVKTEIAPGVFLHMVSHHLYTDQDKTMASITPVDGAINIFSTHGSCIDPLLKMKLHTEQSPREIVIPDTLLKDKNWSYTLLGHIHERGFLGSKDGIHDSLNQKIYYNGSIIRRGFSDKEVPLGRGWTLWTIDSNGVFTPEHRTVAQRPQYDFPIIDGENLSAQAVSDLIVENLISTQVNGAVFDSKSAPLLRQQLKNMDHAKYAAMDWNAIKANSAHALDFKPRVISNKEVEKIEEELLSKTGLSEKVDNTDIVSLYDKWVTEADSYQKIQEELRETVNNETRRFIEAGQEVVLND